MMCVSATGPADTAQASRFQSQSRSPDARPHRACASLPDPGRRSPSPEVCSNSRDNADAPECRAAEGCDHVKIRRDLLRRFLVALHKHIHQQLVKHGAKRGTLPQIVVIIQIPMPMQNAA